MVNRYQIGNAQTIGCREVQSNYFSTAYNSAGNLLAALADGTIDHPNGRKAAIMAVEHCVDAFLQDLVYTDRFLFDTALKINRVIQDAIYVGKSPRLSLSMALFVGRELKYFNVGANKIYLYNGHNEQILSDGLNHSYADGKRELSPKNVIGILSAGAHADAHPMERIKITESKKKIFDKAQGIVEAIKGKGLNNQMNATAILIEVVK